MNGTLAAMDPQRWPALVAGVIVAAYWMRVLRLVRKSRRRVGKAANFIPPEKLGRKLRLIWIPVVSLWIALPLLAAFRSKLPPLVRPIAMGSWVQIAGAIIAAAAFAATLVCWRKMGRSWRMGIDPNEKTTLIVSGPYALVRHPIYALSSLLMAGTMMTAPSPLLLACGLLHLLLLQWEARREEQYLLNTHGQAYAGYRARVGRFVPRFFGRLKHEVRANS